MTDETIGSGSTPVARKGRITGSIITFVAGCAIGVAAGGYGGFQRGMSLILNEALVRDAREVGTRIGILKQLRAGEHDQAVAQLETGLNDILILFDPERPYPGLERQTKVALRSAIDQARHYRGSFQRQINERDFREKMVQNLFSRELYKE